MSQIRNTCVARGSLVANQNTPVYTVPANYAFILKSVVLNAAASGAWTGRVLLQTADTTTTVSIDDFTTAGAGPHIVEHWLVLNATDKIILLVNTVAGAYWISGATLPYFP